MFPVLPMFVPQIPGVDTTQDEAGDNYTVEIVRWFLLSIASQGPFVQNG